MTNYQWGSGPVSKAVELVPGGVVIHHSTSMEKMASVRDGNDLRIGTSFFVA